ncbi:MAG: hypothetical protein ACREEB_15335 [Caulobacteraceae bacterium]
MPLLVTSASGANGDGYGALLAFDRQGRALGPFSEDPRIVDPRGLAVDREQRLLFVNSGADRILALDRRGKVVRDSGEIPGLDPGGGVFAPDGRYCVGMRRARTVMAFPATLDGPGQRLLPDRIVPFPRGFAFAADGTRFLASGIGPGGEGDNAILAFAPDRDGAPRRLVSDPDLSPLDLMVAPNGNILVSSEHPFGAADAVTGVREYSSADGRLVRVFPAGEARAFRRPRGLRFDPGGALCCVARDEVMAFDFASARRLGPMVQLTRLNGQALAFFPPEADTRRDT